MPLHRPSMVADLAIVAHWIRSAEECAFWAGPSVRYPIDLAALPGELQWDDARSASITDGEKLVGYGQLVAKPHGRTHLARIITAPQSRGRGVGRYLVTELVREAIDGKAATISLNVMPRNDTAIRLYASIGFRAARRPADEVLSDAIYMELQR